MSKQQIEQFYPNFESYYTQLVGPNGMETKEVFGLQDYVVNGVSLLDVTIFLDNRLMMINLRTAYLKDGGFEEQKCRSVKDTLVEKYGQATKTEQLSPDNLMLSWKVGQTLVLYTKMDFRATSSVQIVVGYSDAARESYE